MNSTSFEYGETKSAIQSASKTHLSETPKTQAEGIQHEDFYPRDRVQEGFPSAVTCLGQRGATATYVFYLFTDYFIFDMLLNILFISYMCMHVHIWVPSSMI